jgi:hypothetical protein
MTLVFSQFRFLAAVTQLGQPCVDLPMPGRRRVGSRRVTCTRGMGQTCKTL